MSLGCEAMGARLLGFEAEQLWTACRTRWVCMGLSLFWRNCPKWASVSLGFPFQNNPPQEKTHKKKQKPQTPNKNRLMSGHDSSSEALCLCSMLTRQVIQPQAQGGL